MNTSTNISKDALSQIEGAFHREIRGALSKQKQAVIMGKFREVIAAYLPQGYAAVTAEMVRRADHYCPTDLPSFGKWEWKAAHIRQAMLATQQVFDIPAFLRRVEDPPVVSTAAESAQSAPADTRGHQPQPYTASGAAAWIRAGGTASGYAAHRADAVAAEGSSSGSSHAD